MQAAEKAGNLSPEEKRRLEEQAAEKAIQALFKVLIFFMISLSSYHHIILIDWNRVRSSKSSLYYERRATVYCLIHLYHAGNNNCVQKLCRYLAMHFQESRKKEKVKSLITCASIRKGVVNAMPSVSNQISDSFRDN